MAGIIASLVCFGIAALNAGIAVTQIQHGVGTPGWNVGAAILCFGCGLINAAMGLRR